MRKECGQGEDSERAGRDKRMTKGCGQGEDSEGAGRDKRMTKGRGQGEDSERAGRDKTMRKECGQGEIENIGGEVKLGYNQVRREKKLIRKSFYRGLRIRSEQFLAGWLRIGQELESGFIWHMRRKNVWS